MGAESISIRVDQRSAAVTAGPHLFSHATDHQIWVMVETVVETAVDNTEFSAGISATFMVHRLTIRV